ncbi:prephenate dehydratase [Metallumcola ferriviriculae]|uniref:Prephenate dehydratase n=1 Tax=Metallumcola ferriviriculae TaxID=3039180 RepID=A0AAU0URX9_9FIRM|nr:prephenate dehydratase [Desulfitibacteraceae bacterium MK1]
MILAYLGPEGTFSHQAAHYWTRQQDCELVSYPTVMATLLAVSRGDVHLAAVPVENSIEGSVNLTMDFLAKEQLRTDMRKTDISIQGELVLDIVHCLAAVDKSSPLETILSHPQALAQCRGYLENHFPQVRLEQTESTAHAAAIAAARGAGWGAISSAYAADTYNLAVRQKNIADITPNQTRFLLLGDSEPESTGNDKTSLMLALPQDKPGGLYSILQEFAAAGINLTRIESRPSKKELGDYIFFIDCEGHRRTQPLQRVLSLLNTKTALLSVLGSYPVFVQGSDAHD